MKLATEAYLFAKKRISTLLYGSVFILFFSSSLLAQNYKLIFSNTPLSEALLQVSANFQVKVAFDAGKVGTAIVSGEITGDTPEELMEHLLTNTGYTYQKKHDRFLIIEDKPTTAIAPKECFVTGSITDSETGEQLPFASINQPEKRLLVTSSENGTFFLRNTFFKNLHLTISYIGYAAIDTTIVFSNEPVNLNFKLNRKVQSFNVVNVNEAQNEMIEYRKDVDFATTLNPSKLSDLPMLAETDVFKALQLLPGISYSENSSELSIRGGSGDQNLVLYDGQTLYNLSHYFGVFSTVNPNIVKDIQVFKGGYDSRYGERVSGIIDITGKTGNQTKPTIYGDINFISGNIAAEIPLSKKITMVVAGRRSYSDIYKTEFANSLLKNTTSSVNEDPSSTIISTTPKFYYYDYNSKLTYRFNDNENISLNFYGGYDYYNNSYSVTKPSFYSKSADVNKLTNYGLSMAWQKQWNGAFFTNYQIGASGYSNNYTNTTTIEQTQKTSKDSAHLPDAVNLFETTNKNTLSDIALSLRNTWYINDDNQLNFGVLTRQNSLLYYKDADHTYIYDNNKQKSWVSSAYVLDRINLTDRFTIKPGFRLNYYDGNQRMYFEPRLAASYNFSKKYSMRIATGRFYQYLSQVLAQQETGYSKSFWVLADDTIHPVLQSDHFIVGSTLDFGNLLFDVEGYYKNFSGIQEYVYVSQYLRNSDFSNYFNNPNNQNQSQSGTSGNSPLNPRTLKSTEAINLLPPSYFFKGKGHSVGLDFFVRYKIKGYTSWVSYSLSKTVHQFAQINQNAEMPAPTDQTHQVSWSQMYAFKKWNFGTITLFNTGRPYIDYTVNSDNLPTTRYYKRLPNYFRSDVTVNYNFRLNRARLKVGASIINIFNTQNYFDVNTRKIDFQTSTFDETNLIRAQKLSLNLFMHFLL